MVLAGPLAGLTDVSAVTELAAAHGFNLESVAKAATGVAKDLRLLLADTRLDLSDVRRAVARSVVAHLLTDRDDEGPTKASTLASTARPSMKWPR
ncbi:hypothetical protein [Catenulispora rubra]|uniref:hypothetical protein n=1 Tax=Catenulispora rubra TaxID=280293 RepID=UPI0018923B22|nr:hypothetical protein [Catenulispora rubra]